jgi:hypothetical protein
VRERMAVRKRVAVRERVAEVVRYCTSKLPCKMECGGTDTPGIAAVFLPD